VRDIGSEGSEAAERIGRGPADKGGCAPLALPPDHALGGFRLSTQALVVGPTLDFSNALDLTLGL
jgi:hypothetical protein